MHGESVSPYQLFSMFNLNFISITNGNHNIILYYKQNIIRFSLAKTKGRRNSAIIIETKFVLFLGRGGGIPVSSLNNNDGPGKQARDVLLSQTLLNIGGT